jgi:Tol biopolymer transport system component
LISKDICAGVNGNIGVYANMGVYALGPITRDGAYYFRRGRPTDGMAQLMTTRFDPDAGKVVGTPTFVSRMGGDQRSPSFSRDGRWLAYTVQSPARVFSLVVQSVESGEETVVPMDPKPASLGGAMMFPDGRSVLVAATHPKDGRGFYRVDVATGAWTSLKKPGEKGEVWGEMDGGGISADGETIYFCRSQSSLTDPYVGSPLPLIARDIETGQEREVTRLLPSWTFGLAFDGTQLAVGNKDGNDLVLKIVPTAGGTSREIFRDSTSRVFGAPVWMPDGQNLIFEASRTSLGDTAGYMIVPVAGGAARSIGIAPSQGGQFPQTFGAVRVHPNGRQFVYVARSGKGPYNAQYETWVLENFLPKAAK